MRAPLKKVIMAKYVRLLEIFGYGLAALILALWVLFFFIPIDENCFGTGPIRPATLDIVAPSRAVLVGADVATDQWVKKDQVIFRLNLNEEAVAARQAQADLASLGSQILTLAKKPSDREDLENSVAYLVKKVGGLATGKEEKALLSPVDGFLKYALPTTTATLTNAVVAGPLAQVISSHLMQADVELGQMNRDRVAVGQKVNINIRIDPEHPKQKTKLVGKVIKVPEPGRATIEAPVTDNAIGQLLARQISNQAVDAQPLKAEVKIVVARVRFVRLLFPTNAAAAAPAAEKKENFVMRMWHKVFPAK